MVALIIRDETSTPRTITELIIRDGTNTPRTITELWIRDASNIPRLVFNPGGGATLSVTVAPDPTNKVAGDGSGVGTTPAVTATVVGGTAPFTYAWTTISYTSGIPPTVNSPTAAVTTFTQTGMAHGDVESAVFRVTVTDALAATTYYDTGANWAAADPGGFI
jgi:hypothetical protein